MPCCFSEIHLLSLLSPKICPPLQSQSCVIGPSVFQFAEGEESEWSSNTEHAFIDHWWEFSHMATTSYKRDWEIQFLAEELCDLLKLCYCAACCNAVCSSVVSIAFSWAGGYRGLIKLRFNPFGKTVFGAEFFHQDELNVWLSFFLWCWHISCWCSWVLINGYLNPLIHGYGDILIIHFICIYYLEYIYKEMLSLIYYLVIKWQVKILIVYLFSV